MKLTFSDVKSVAISSSEKENDVQGFASILTDSRKESPNSLFIPIVGDRFDGHEFLLHAIDKGATGTLWQEGKELPQELSPSFPVFFVKDTTIALQNLATLYRRKLGPKVIGVTGSNGKTTTKDMLEAVLSRRFKTFKTEGNLNNHWGLPFTILAMPEDTELLILEMGMNNFGEISLLSKIAEPDLAVITNIGESHLENLGSREGISQAKLEILDGLKEKGIIILDGDEPLLAGKTVQKKITCGYKRGNDYTIHLDEHGVGGQSFRLSNNDTQFEVGILGEHNVKNAAYAIIAAKILGVNEADIKKGLKELKLTSMRLESSYSQHGSLILNDAYNASPTSMKAAIETIKNLPGFTKKVVVLGDMYELGSKEKELHENIAYSITLPISVVITVGEKGKWIYDKLVELALPNLQIQHYQNKEEVTPHLKRLEDSNTVILLKASRGLALETVIQPLL